METVKKEQVWDRKKWEVVWKIVETKNAVFRQMVSCPAHNRQVEYVLAVSW